MSRSIRTLWRQHYLHLDLLSVILAVSIVVYWSIVFGNTSAIDLFRCGNWNAVYQTTASIAVVLLGFSLTTVSLVGAYVSKPEFTTLRQSRHYPVLWRTIFSGVRYLGVLAVWSLFGLIADSETDSVLWIRYVFLFLFVVSAIRVIRSIWITKNVVSIETSKSV